MEIKDSGNRREFSTGAVRDIQEGKGRCDLLPLEVVAQITGDVIFQEISEFQKDGDTSNLYDALEFFAEIYGGGIFTMILDVAKHFEAGALKYGENNWQKGLPPSCYIDSALRHYLKFKRGDDDEPHDRAFVWNLMCCCWEVDYHANKNS